MKARSPENAMRTREKSKRVDRLLCKKKRTLKDTLKKLYNRATEPWIYHPISSGTPLFQILIRVYYAKFKTIEGHQYPGLERAALGIPLPIPNSTKKNSVSFGVPF